MSEQLQEVAVAPIAPPPPPVEPAAPAPSGEQTADQAPAQETPTEPNPEKQAKSRFERRIDAANRRFGQEKARADFLAAEVEKLRPKPVSAPGEPKLESFSDIETYAEAKAEYRKNEAIKEFQSKQQQETVKNSVSRLSQEWESKTVDAESKWDDFHDVVGELTPTTPLSAALMKSDPALAYHLGKHPAEARKLAAMEPIDQLISLGRLAAKLESTPPVAEQPSKAPAPINPVSGKSPSASETPSEDDDMRTWIRKRNKQVRGK